MDNNFYSNKYMILLAALCILLVAITIRAFNYIPQPIDDDTLRKNEPAQENVQPTEDKTDSETSNRDDDDNDDDEEDDDDDEENDDNNSNSKFDAHHKHGHIDYMPEPTRSNVDIDEIPAPKGTEEENINVVNE